MIAEKDPAIFDAQNRAWLCSSCAASAGIDAHGETAHRETEYCRHCHQATTRVIPMGCSWCRKLIWCDA